MVMVTEYPPIRIVSPAGYMAIRAAPMAALELTLKTIRVHDERDPGDSGVVICSRLPHFVMRPEKLPGCKEKILEIQNSSAALESFEFSEEIIEFRRKIGDERGPSVTLPIDRRASGWVR
jgi:hypothetical protein